MVSVGVPLPPTGRPAQARAGSDSKVGSSTLVMLTVAKARFGLSTSVTVTPLSTTTAPPPSVNDVLPPVVVTTGASLAGATDTFFVAGVLVSAPWLATKEITRVVLFGSWWVLL